MATTGIIRVIRVLIIRDIRYHSNHS